jgi:hypothetical protein
MTQKLDLNRLRDVVIENAAQGNAKPADPSKQVYVDKDANLVFGDGPRNPHKAATQVINETFSGPAGEQKYVREKMPSGTREVVTDEGIRGWLYPVVSSLGDAYQLFAYNNGANWQVLVVSPEIESKLKDVHESHLFSDGRICLSKRHGGGAPTLEEAYSRSVLWATGMSVAMQTGKFAFNPS